MRILIIIGLPFDFDYVEEHVIANGKDLKELWASVQCIGKCKRKGGRHMDCRSLNK